MLLGRGAPVNQPEVAGATVLMAACMQGWSGAVQRRAIDETTLWSGRTKQGEGKPQGQSWQWGEGPSSVAGLTTVIAKSLFCPGLARNYRLVANPNPWREPS